MKTNPSHPCSPGRTARFQRLSTGLLAGTLLAFSSLHAQTSTIYGLTADRQVNSAGVLSDTTPMQSGYSGTTGMNPVFVFQLPALPVGKEFSNASLRAYQQGKDGTPSFNADLYGVGVSSSSAVSASDYYAGAFDSASILIKDNLLTPSSGAGPVVTSAVELTDFLNAAYANGSGAGKYVFLRLNPDVAGLNNYTRYKLYSADYSGGAYYWPSLTYDTADALLGWHSVPLGGGGYVSGLISDPTGNDIYCRTDVGGAFKWNASAGAWDSITDTIVPTYTTGASKLMGTGAIALDPSDSNKLYVAVGAATGSIYASSDKGASWSLITSSTVPVDANGAFRSFGERLAVDPNNPNLVWFGSTTAGLYKGVKSGSSWTWTQVASSSVPFGDSSAGVTFVACDKNGASTITYAGVYDSTGATGGIYMTADGVTWSKVSGTAIDKPARGQVAPNGTLYVTGYGVIGRMLRGGSLSAITPVAALDYRGLAVAPSDTSGNTVYIAEAPAGTGRIWRSTSGGASWAVQNTTAFNDNGTITRQEPDGTRTLTGYWFGRTSSLLANPVNANELWAGDFFGVARTQNAQLMGGTTAGNQPVWYMLQKGQDETVVEVVKNAPTGPRLLTGVADVGGFYYNDLTSRPYGTAGGGLWTPGSANTTSLDFSEGNDDVWARAYYGNDSTGTGAYSRDSGLSWLHFGEIARKSIDSGAAGVEEWDLSTYLATQKAKGATLVTLVLASDNVANFNATPVSFSSREDADPALRPALLVNGSTSLVAVADTYVSGATATLTTNYGNVAYLNVAHAYTTNTTNERHTYLKFDLSGVSSITSAKLRLNRRAATAGLTYNVGVFACANTSWVEGDGGTENLPAGEITWNTCPRPYASASGRPFGVPDYKSAAGVMLRGGRVAISSANPDLLVWMPFGTSTVPHYSNDRGVTWTPCVGLPANVNRLAGKSNPSYLLIQLASDRGNGQFYMTHLSTGSGHHTVYRSTDGGANWSSVGTISAGTYNIYRTQIVGAPAANDVWFCDDGVNGTTNGGVWRSTDGGGTWSKILGSSIKCVRQVSFGKAASGSGYTVFINGYKDGLQGVYRSDDYGATWTRLPDVPSCISIESLAGDRQEYGRVFIGTGGRGVFQGKN